VTVDIQKKAPKQKGGRPSLKVTRIIKEDMTKKSTEIELFSKQKARTSKDDDFQLENLDLALKGLEKEYGKTSSEIAEIFCLVSGRLPKVREYLNYEKNVKK
jgi:hypothetical protein